MRKKDKAGVAVVELGDRREKNDCMYISESMGFVGWNHSF